MALAKGWQNGSGDEQEDDLDASNDGLASMMEISLDTTDDPQINIAEIHDSAKYQPLSENRSQASRASAEARRAKLVRKLYGGGFFTTLLGDGRYSPSERYFIHCLRLTIPSSIDADHLRAARLEAELVDKDSKQPITKRLTMSDEATVTAQRLAISVTVYAKDGSMAQFWAQNGSLQTAELAHDLVQQLEAVQAELAPELS